MKTFVRFFTAIRMHEWPQDQANWMQANKLFLREFFLGLQTEQY